MYEYLDPLTGASDGYLQDVPELMDDAETQWTQRMAAHFARANPGVLTPHELDGGENDADTPSYRAYNPDEPRDQDGKWTGGGSSSASSFAATHHATKLLHETVGAKGGFSYHAVSGKRPRSGWMVALQNAELELPVEKMTPKTIKDYVQAHAKDLIAPDRYLGGWYNRENKHVYLDISQNVKDLSQAEQLGRQRDQFGIFNVHSHEYRALKANQAATRLFAVFRSYGPEQPVGDADGSLHHAILDKNNPEAAYAALQAMIGDADKR